MFDNLDFKGGLFSVNASIVGTGIIQKREEENNTWKGSCWPKNLQE